MNKILKAVSGVMLIAAAVPAIADSYVRGYTRSDGTYVAPHYRSSPDSNYNNNWSVRPNINPYTGQWGTQSPTWNNQSPGDNFNSPNYGYGYRRY